MEIPRGRGGHQPHQRRPSYRDQQYDDKDEDEDEYDESHHRGSLSTASNIPRSNTVHAASFNDQASMRSMSTVTGPYSQSYEPVSRELASRRTGYATESQESTRPDNSVQPRNLLVEFLRLPLSDFKHYAAFVYQNPAILEQQEAWLQTQAIQAYRVNNGDLAERYLQLTLILHKCKRKNLSLEDTCRYIQDLASKSYRGKYYDDLDQFVSAAKERAGLSSTSPADTAQRMQGLNLGDASRFQPAGKNDRNDQTTGQVLRLDNRQRKISGQELGPQPVLATLQNQSQPRPFSMEGARQRSQTQGGYARSTINNLPSTLDAGFKVEPSQFFAVGRVFKVLWHQPAGSNLQGKVTDSTSVGKFDEPIYTTARWMLVVKNYLGHCICCPISTYRGRGLHGKSYRQPNIKAHAMIYAYGMQAPEDDDLTKDPIQVIVQESGIRVNPISSVNFSKLHTVEHNVKVANIGMVPKTFHGTIFGYVSDEFLT